MIAHRAAPLGVIFLISGKLLRGGEPSASGYYTEATRLGIFVLTVFSGLAVQAFLLLPLIYFACTGRSPYRLLGQIGPALVTAFGTSSRWVLGPEGVLYYNDLRPGEAYLEYTEAV